MWLLSDLIPNALLHASLVNGSTLLFWGCLNSSLLALKAVLKLTDRQTNTGTKFKMVCGRTIKLLQYNLHKVTWTKHAKVTRWTSLMDQLGITSLSNILGRLAWLTYKRKRLDGLGNFGQLASSKIHCRSFWVITRHCLFYVLFSLCLTQLYKVAFD